MASQFFISKRALVALAFLVIFITPPQNTFVTPPQNVFATPPQNIQLAV